MATNINIQGYSLQWGIRELEDQLHKRKSIHILQGAKVENINNIFFNNDHLYIISQNLLCFPENNF